MNYVGTSLKNVFTFFVLKVKMRGKKLKTEHTHNRVSNSKIRIFISLILKFPQLLIVLHL